MTTQQWQWELSLSAWQSAGMVLLMLAILAYVLWVYVIDSRDLQVWRRTLGVALRLSVFGLLLVIFFSPQRVKTHVYEDAGSVLLYVDLTASMSTDDGTPQSRRERVFSALRKDKHQFLSALNARHALRIFGLCDTIVPLAEFPHQSTKRISQWLGETQLPEVPVDVVTDLTRVAQHAIGQKRQFAVSGVIVIGDGRHSQASDWRPSVERLAEEGIRLHTVGVGNRDYPFNLRLYDTKAPDTVFKDEPYQLQSMIELQGRSAAQVPVTLMGRKSAKAPFQPIATKTVSVQAGSPALVRFQLTNDAPASWTYRLVAAVQPEETSDRDNQQTVIVDVTDKKMKVLLAAGHAMWDYQLLRQRLRREAAIDLACYLQLRTTRAAHENHVTQDMHYPESWEGYDVVVALDLDPSKLPLQWGDLMRDRVKRSGMGLFMVPGAQYGADMLRRFGAELAEVLPVNIDRTQSDVTPVAGNVSWHIGASGAQHPALQLVQGGDGPSASGDKAWDAMHPGLKWWRNVSAQPGAEVLLFMQTPDASSRIPFLSHMRLGTGHSMMMLNPETWQLRRKDVAFFDRFWLQSIRKLLEGSRDNRERGIRLDYGMLHVGQRQGVTVRVDPSTLLPPTLTLSTPNQDTRSLVTQPVEGRPGVFRGYYTPTEPGDYALQREGDRGTAIDTHPFYVTQQWPELNDTRLDSATLSRLASVTGGEMVMLPEMSTLLEKIPEKTYRWTQADPPQALWDNPWWLSAIIGLLCVEWAMRRSWGLY